MIGSIYMQEKFAIIERYSVLTSILLLPVFVSGALRRLTKATLLEVRKWKEEDSVF